MWSTDGKVLGFDEGIKSGLSDGKVLGTIFGDVDGITVGIDVGSELGSLDGYFCGSKNGNTEGFCLEDSLRSTYGNVLGIILINVDWITPGIDVGKELGSIDGSFDCSNNGNHGGLFLVDSLISTEGKVFGSD